ncbi:hypothetical protein [Geotalea sp. SG265]|uniref:hypothetical protein n=1 Tax=Geotalea sp. SG265 TaxID=2922867 RepID=UPI001FAF92B9|nr:hypothetical protein [Geotalea sp. SG265]
MSLKKKMLAVAAVGALTAATAVPAMAFENEFHGMYRFKGVMSNVQNASGAHFATISDDPQTKTFLEQRARLLYSAKASDDLKLVTHFELDYSKFGDNSYNVGRNNGGALGADEVNLETKSVYLDFNLPTATKINFKVGMQPWVDSYGGLVVNADMAGVLASAKYGDLANSIGFFRFDDDAGRKGFEKALSGKNTRDFLALDSKYNVTKDFRVGATYYLLNDDLNADNAALAGAFTTDAATTASTGTNSGRVANSSITHMVGVNAQAKVGIATIDGGLIYQFGTLDTPVKGHLSAFGGYVGSKVAAGPGTVNFVAAYTSGDSTPGAGNSNAFQSVQNTTSSGVSENTFYGANLHILLRSKYEINSGGYIVGSSNNKNQGMTVGALGYDMKFTDKLYGNANIGAGAVAKTNGNSGSADSKYLGTEINAEVGYKLTDNLNVSVVGAFMKLGNYYKGNAKNANTGAAIAAGDKPNDPFYSTVMLNYVF